ncbi:hypothetical protein Salat_2113600 [Sesamum alatum]|uniref:Uncharacterized protein n=1 Tax=Sesamum alatum TaxID=300844 RepID=A0AAE1Y0T4_9LAMI|nr:hypothetical protein Salat_2113600 [Sesamum alatum]
MRSNSTSGRRCSAFMASGSNGLHGVEFSLSHVYGTRDRRLLSHEAMKFEAFSTEVQACLTPQSVKRGVVIFGEFDRSYWSGTEEGHVDQGESRRGIGHGCCSCNKYRVVAGNVPLRFTARDVALEIASVECKITLAESRNFPDRTGGYVSLKEAGSRGPGYVSRIAHRRWSKGGRL